MKNILVFFEHLNGKLAPSAMAAACLAQRLRAVYPGNCVGLLLGPGASTAAKELAPCGLDVLLVNDAADFAPYMAETHAAALLEVAKQQNISVVAGISSSMGKDCLPRLAGMMDVGYLSDVVDILGEGLFSRIAYAGSILEKVQCSSEAFVLSARQVAFSGSMAPAEKNAAITVCSLKKPDALGSSVLAVHEQTKTRPELTSARIVVSGGRGLREKQNFVHLEEICDLLHAALGASRAACDAGLVSSDLQVGQTGKVVAPDLYVAVAISGAIQHVAGMKNSKVIVAINKDPAAPIFQIADYGLVQTWEKALPELISALKKRHP